MVSILLKSPTQASDIYSQQKRFPKQKVAFLVRFNTNGSQIAPANTMTFAVKQVDRPSVTPHMEELNQYNKKRFVYTGYKLNPLKVTLYDTADNSAQGMWASYQRYYFGDFSQPNPNMFSGNDIYGNFNDGVGNYGLILPKSQSNDSQYYFSTIEILHFYDNTYDLYTIVNPRITSFTPDDLDYSESAVSTVNIEFSYEALLFVPNKASSASVSEFQQSQTGLSFFGSNTDGGATSSFQPDQSTSFTSFDQFGNQNFNPSSLFSGGFSGSSIANIPDYRYFSSPSSGALGVFGNFSFGPASSVIGGINFGASISNNLAYMATSNASLAATLNLTSSSTTNVLGGDFSPYSSYYSSPPSLSGSLYDSTTAQLGASLSGTFGNIKDIIAGGVMGSVITGTVNPLSIIADGVTLDASAFGLINSQRSGIAQYGYNPNVSPDGQNYGSGGPTGFTGPQSGLYGGTNPFDYLNPQDMPSVPTAIGNVASPTQYTAPIVPVTAAPLSPPSDQSNQSIMQPGTTDANTGFSTNSDYSANPPTFSDGY